MNCRRPSSNNASRSWASLLFWAIMLGGLVMLAPNSATAADRAMPKLGKAQKWQVGPIHKPGKDDARFFCSAKAGFSNGVTLVIGRDSDGGQSLALEYDGDFFAAGATLPVVLNTGGHQQQSNALAATRRILLLGLARGGAIESQLMANTALDVTANQKRHIFAIGGYPAVSASLDECLTSTIAGEKFAVVKHDADAPSDSFQTSTHAVEKSVQRFTNVSPEEAKSFHPAEAARAAVLQDEIDQLRRQNRELLMQRQAIDNQLLAAPAAETHIPASPIIQRSVKNISWPASEKFDDIVATYMTTEAARCQADFAQTQGRTYPTVQGSIRETEIACLGTPAALGGATRDYAAALLFAGGQGEIQIVMFQGPAGLIEQALAERTQALTDMGIQP